MRRLEAILLILALSSPLLLAGCGEVRATGTAADLPTRTKTLLSPVYTVDRKYPSMKGPYSSQFVQLVEDGAESAEEELVWIVGYEATMVGADGESAMPQDFMCHSNLDIDVQAHHRKFGNLGFNPRLFTLSQGQLSIQFPPGFGIPVMSSEQLSLTTQVLNHNVEGQTFDVRHRVAISYVRDAELEGRSMTPLFPASGYGLALLEGGKGYFGVQEPDPEQHGPGCLVGDNAATHEYEDRMGRKFTGHWVVKPGREVNRTLVTELMRIPYETTLHYIAVHLHPFAESLELKDLTTGEVLFASKAVNHEDRIGLARVDYLSSVEGITVYPEHEYEITSVYNNITDQDQDSMAVMYLYLKDQRFDRGDRLKKKLAEARAKLNS